MIPLEQSKILSSLFDKKKKKQKKIIENQQVSKSKIKTLSKNWFVDWIRMSVVGRTKIICIFFLQKSERGRWKKKTAKKKKMEIKPVISSILYMLFNMILIFGNKARNIQKKKKKEEEERIEKIHFVTN